MKKIKNFIENYIDISYVDIFVWKYVRCPVVSSILCSVEDSVVKSVWVSVQDSVWKDSGGNSALRDSVRDSVSTFTENKLK